MVTTTASLLGQGDYLLPAPPNGKSFSVQLSGVEFVWEQHSEFSTYSLIKPGAS